MLNVALKTEIFRFRVLWFSCFSGQFIDHAFLLFSVCIMQCDNFNRKISQSTCLEADNIKSVLKREHQRHFSV